MAPNPVVHPAMEPKRRAVVLALQALSVGGNLPSLSEKHLLRDAIDIACGTSPCEELSEALAEQASKLRQYVEEGFDSGRGLARIADELDGHAAALLKVDDPPQPEWFTNPAVRG